MSVQVSHVHGGAVRERDSDPKEWVRRLEPAPAVFVSSVWISSSESRVRSMALLSMLCLAALSASL